MKNYIYVCISASRSVAPVAEQRACRGRHWRSLPDAFRAGFWGPIFAEVPPSGSCAVDRPGRLPALPVVPQGVLYLCVEEAVEQGHGEALQQHRKLASFTKSTNTRRVIFSRKKRDRLIMHVAFNAKTRTCLLGLHWSMDFRHAPVGFE